MTAVTWQSPDYEVTFNQDITAGAPVGTTTGTNGNNKATHINAAHNDPGPAQLDVETFDSAGPIATRFRSLSRCGVELNLQGSSSRGINEGSSK